MSTHDSPRPSTGDPLTDRIRSWKPLLWANQGPAPTEEELNRFLEEHGRIQIHGETTVESGADADEDSETRQQADQELQDSLDFAPRRVDVPGTPHLYEVSFEAPGTHIEASLGLYVMAPHPSAARAYAFLIVTHPETAFDPALEVTHVRLVPDADPEPVHDEIDAHLDDELESHDGELDPVDPKKLVEALGELR